MGRPAATAKAAATAAGILDRTVDALMQDHPGSPKAKKATAKSPLPRIWSDLYNAGRHAAKSVHHTLAFIAKNAPTVQAGLTFNLQLGLLNLNTTYGVIVDRHGNIGNYSCVGTGVGFGMDIFGGLNVAASNAHNIDGMKGLFSNASGNAGDFEAGGLDTFLGQDSLGRPVTGLGASLGYGAGADFAVGNSWTKIWRPFPIR